MLICSRFLTLVISGTAVLNSDARADRKFERSVTPRTRVPRNQRFARSWWFDGVRNVQILCYFRSLQVEMRRPCLVGIRKGASPYPLLEQNIPALLPPKVGVGIRGRVKGHFFRTPR